MEPWAIITYTAEEERYEKRLEEIAIAILGPEWRACWPEHTNRTRPVGHIYDIGPYGCLDTFILRTEQQVEGSPAVCFIEGITLPWCVRLGVSWKMDPSFWVHHVRLLDTTEASRLLHEGAVGVPGATSSLSNGSSSWAILCGHADHGEPKRPMEDSDFRDTINRQHQLSVSGQRLNHTNLSIYRLSEELHVVVSDILPDWAFDYYLDERCMFPNQILVRLPTLASPGHLTLPYLRKSRIWGTAPLWPLTSDEIDRHLLLHPLKDWNIDEFLYRATLLHCEDELSCLTAEVYGIQRKRQLLSQGQAEEAAQWSPDRPERELIEGYQQAADRLQMCVSENRQYERKPGKSEGLQTAYSEEERCSFEKLAKEVDELKNMLSDSLYRLEQEGRQEAEDERKRIAAMREAKAKALLEIRKMRLLGVALIAVPVVCAAVMAGIRVRRALRCGFEDGR